MRFLIKFYILTISVLCSVNCEKMRVTGTVGQSITILCKYPTGYGSYVKYWCKGDCRRSTLLGGGGKDLVKTAERELYKREGRFSLQDDPAAGVFTVTITDLNPQDEGTDYYCAIEIRLLIDWYQEVELRVRPAEGQTNKSPTTTDEETTSPSITGPVTESKSTSSVTKTSSTTASKYSKHKPALEDHLVTIIAVVLVLFLLLLLLATLLYFKKKKKQDPRDVLGDDMTINYEEIGPKQTSGKPENEIQYSEIQFTRDNQAISKNQESSAVYSNVNTKDYQSGVSPPYACVKFSNT
nr:PREDICTED: CMRF35-like molecule 2 [Latimeria chalumnae]|eukprot:XP_005987712.1 PREDICTED: CMRF35-like molecule 2 [Latimeria chalumnae]